MRKKKRGGAGDDTPAPEPGALQRWADEVAGRLARFCDLARELALIPAPPASDDLGERVRLLGRVQHAAIHALEAARALDPRIDGAHRPHLLTALAREITGADAERTRRAARLPIPPSASTHVLPRGERWNAVADFLRNVPDWFRGGAEVLICPHADVSHGLLASVPRDMIPSVEGRPCVVLGPPRRPAEEYTAADAREATTALAFWQSYEIRQARRRLEERRLEQQQDEAAALLLATEGGMA